MSDQPATSPLTHFDADGQAHMVDVSPKPDTYRVARAGGRIAMLPATLALIERGEAGKGDVLGVARIAGIQAAKRTAELIPLCHPLSLSSVAVDLSLDTRILIFTMGTTAAAVVLFGLVPALRVSRLDLASSIRAALICR